MEAKGGVAKMVKDEAWAASRCTLLRESYDS